MYFIIQIVAHFSLYLGQLFYFMLYPWVCLNELGVSLTILTHLMVIFIPFKRYIQFSLPFAQEWISSNPKSSTAMHCYQYAYVSWDEGPDFVNFAHVISVTLTQTLSSSKFSFTDCRYNSKWLVSLSLKGLSKFDLCTFDFLRQALHPGVTHQNMSGDRGTQCHVAVFSYEIF